MLEAPANQAISAFQPVKGNQSLDRIAENTDDFRAGDDLRHALARHRRDEVSGRHFAHGFGALNICVMGAIPLQAALEMRVEKAGFFRRPGKQSVRAEDLVDPAAACAWRSDNEKGGKALLRSG